MNVDTSKIQEELRNGGNCEEIVKSLGGKEIGYVSETLSYNEDDYTEEEAVAERTYYKIGDDFYVDYNSDWEGRHFEKISVEEVAEMMAYGFEHEGFGWISVAQDLKILKEIANAVPNYGDEIKELIEATKAEKSGYER